MDFGTLILMPILGIGLGVLTGALGTGGGLLAVPLLVLACGLEQKQAQGTALVMITLFARKAPPFPRRGGPRGPPLRGWIAPLAQNPCR